MKISDVESIDLFLILIIILLIINKTPDINVIFIIFTIILFYMYKSNKDENFCTNISYMTDLTSLPTIHKEDRVKYLPRMDNLASVDSGLYKINPNSNIWSYNADSTMFDKTIYQTQKHKRQNNYNASYNNNMQNAMRRYIIPNNVASDGAEWWDNIYY